MATAERQNFIFKASSAAALPIPDAHCQAPITPLLLFNHRETARTRIFASTIPATERIHTRLSRVFPHASLSFTFTRRHRYDARVDFSTRSTEPKHRHFITGHRAIFAGLLHWPAYHHVNATSTPTCLPSLHAISSSARLSSVKIDNLMTPC